MEASVVGAVVGATIQVVLQTLLNMSVEQISLIQPFKKDLEKLKSSFDTVHDILYDASMQRVTDRAVKRWLRSLEDVAFDADNVLDEINYQLLSTKVDPTQNTTRKKVQSFFSNNTTLAGKIRDINKRLEISNQQAISFGLHTRLAGARAPGPDASVSVETDSFSVDPIFLGRGNDVTSIVEMLINTSSRDDQQVLSVLPIVGMGGLGKTTLAKKVFGNEKIISHFGDNRVWVYVSRNFDVRNILKNILTSLTEEKFELETKQVLLKKLKKHLESKKYLLVLDDVWNKNSEEWDDVVNSLSGISSANGNCMIVTTRSDDVSSIVETLRVHKLKGLSEDECWSIIKAKAFRGRNVLLDFEAIGKNIAKKCQGLPLAAKVVGGLLSRKKLKYEWMSIEKNWLSDLGDQNRISNVLKLSFDDLPSPSLKKCFAYSSIFPKGYEIEKERLVELWMAEGFLQTSMETTGNENFSILLQNSLLQHARSDGYGNVTHCNMHDLVHDLACLVSCENDDGTGGVCKSRYIGYKPGGGGLSSIPKGQERYVRTLFVDGKVSDIKFSDFESLHTLTLVGIDIDDLPTTIKELKHLRYLDISETNIRSLPDSIGELYHLQTFRSQEYIYWAYMEKLPDSFSCLISLRHLHISPKITLLLPKIGKLTSLQALPSFHVGDEEGYRISELGKLKNLKGKLEIRNLEKVRDKNEATSADLIGKPGIGKIELVWGDQSREGEDESNVDESVLEGLQPHPNLMKLEINGFNGKSLPPWTCKMAVQLDGNCSWEGLNNLVEIKLVNCSKCEELPMLGHLPQLKSLKLCGLTNVKSIGPSFYGSGNTISNNGSICVVVFPALKSLEMREMTNLKEWDDLPSDEVVVFPRLKYLEIEECYKLMRAPSHFPCLNSLDTLYIRECPDLKSIPYYPSSRGGQQQQKQGLTSLKDLRIKNCTGLNNLPTEMLESCALSLETLTLEGLSSLTNVSEVIGCCLHKMTRLTSLEIDGVPEIHIGLYDNYLRMGPLSDSSRNNASFNETVDAVLLQLNTSLRKLTLHGMEHWECLPDGIQHLTSLQKLTLTHFGIEALPAELFGNLSSSLEILGLENCKKLRHFPSKQAMQRLSKLTTLYIDFCPLLLKERRSNNNSYYYSEGPQIVDSEWPKISHIPSLRRLELSGMEHWECLTDGIQHLTSLQELYLDGFGIEALPEWFGNLSSLKYLYLIKCKKLRHFPSKQAMQRLSKLTDLTIKKCPLLLKEGSDSDSEWHKISHIPDIKVY